MKTNRKSPLKPWVQKTICTVLGIVGFCSFILLAGEPTDEMNTSTYWLIEIIALGVFALVAVIFNRLENAGYLTCFDDE